MMKRKTVVTLPHRKVVLLADIIGLWDQLDNNDRDLVVAFAERLALTRKVEVTQ